MGNMLGAPDISYCVLCCQQSLKSRFAQWEVYESGLLPLFEKLDLKRFCRLRQPGNNLESGNIYVPVHMQIFK